MYRVAVVQNQSESLRAGYADVAQNFGADLRLPDYEFVAFDGGNIQSLFDPDAHTTLSTFDSLFISTNATSDAKTRRVLSSNQLALADFLRSGKGVYLGYQKKMSVKSAEDPLGEALLPSPYEVVMVERPKSETDSSAGTITSSPRSAQAVGSFLLLNSPNSVPDSLVMTHCHENDFKAHTYRSMLSPVSEAAFDSVLEDASYGPISRRLILVNRSSLAGERVVVSTIAIDWENHQRLLENVIAYVTEGVPRVALVSKQDQHDRDFDFIRSTAKLLRVSNRHYSTLASIPAEFAGIHDVYVVSSKWSKDDVAQFWGDIAGTRQRAVQPAAAFRRLYHLGDHEDLAWSSLTRYVNYTSIDVMLNDALLWLEQQFDGGFWAGGFWNTHDVLQMMEALGLDVSAYIPGVLRDMEPHLRIGGYDAVMGPSCGLLSLLNRLSIRYGSLLEECGFGIARRAQVATWVVSNLEGQSDVARQVAARALFGRGGEAVVEALANDGLGEAVSSLKGIVRTGLNLPISRLGSLSEMDLVRIIQLSHGTPALEVVLAGAMTELVCRQDDSGLWGSVGRTANILTSILEIDAEEGDASSSQSWDEATARGVEALRGSYDAQSASWGGIIQDTAMSVHALGLYRSRYDVESQELFETVEAEAKSTQPSVSVGRARIDLSELFGRELRRDAALHQLDVEASLASRQARSAESDLARMTTKARFFQTFGGASFLLLVSLLVSFALSERDALGNVFGSTGSLLGLVIGAIIAIPITLLLLPGANEQPTHDPDEKDIE